MTEPTDAVTLTADDLKALRLADRVVFSTYHGEGKTPAIRAWIERRQYSDAPAIFSASEQRLFPVPNEHGERARLIPVRTVVSGWDNDGRDQWHDDGKASAFYSIHAAQWDQDWRTLADHVLRAGDVLHVAFRAGNNNANMRSVGFQRDEVRLIVTRGARTLSFLLDVNVGPDDTARMVKRYGY